MNFPTGGFRMLVTGFVTGNPHSLIAMVYKCESSARSRRTVLPDVPDCSLASSQAATSMDRTAAIDFSAKGHFFKVPMRIISRAEPFLEGVTSRP
jgi:hypothetical protein